MTENSYAVPYCPNIKYTDLVEVDVPGSKSITNRALLLAAMAEGTSHIRGALTSEDAAYFVTCLKTLGFEVTEERDGGLNSDITITGHGGAIPSKEASIYVGSAGTAARFLVAMLALSDGEYTVDSSAQMKKRPMQSLITTLREAGAEVDCLESDGHFPLHIIGARRRGALPDSFCVNIDESSQFLSALMIAVGTLGHEAVIHVTGSHGLGYVALTADLMRDFGVTAAQQEQNGALSYSFTGTERYHALDYNVEPDMSAAAYFYALAAVLGVRVSVRGVHAHMLQGDTAFLSVLEKMGCDVQVGDKVIVTGAAGGRLKGGFPVDMSAFSDQALTLAAIAPYADAPITITGIGHIRLQECDRIHAIVHNLTALGIRVQEADDTVTIYPAAMHGCEIETFDDHRVAMSFALTGLRTEGVTILNPSCCKKTFAEYFSVLDGVIDTVKAKIS